MADAFRESMNVHYAGTGRSGESERYLDSWKLSFGFAILSFRVLMFLFCGFRSDRFVT